MRSYLMIMLFCGGFKGLCAMVYTNDAQRTALHNLNRAIELRSCIAALKELSAMGTTYEPRYVIGTQQCPLVHAYPGLSQLPYIALGTFPTPLERMITLSDQLNVDLWIKRDDLAGSLDENKTPTFGGNKERKFEFILGDALNRGSRMIINIGSVVSNLSPALALCAQRLGLSCSSFLYHSPGAAMVQHNLLLAHNAGAQLHWYPLLSLLCYGVAHTMLEYNNAHGSFPYVVPGGGASPLGVLGGVNAAFELAEQCKNTGRAMPDVIYIALGSGTMTAGLMLGLQALGSSTKIRAICIVRDPPENPVRDKVRALFEQTVAFLRSHDEMFPALAFNDEQLEIDSTMLGAGYGIITQESKNAVLQVHKAERIMLDGVYTGKTMAALMRDANNGLLKDKTVIFWDTYSVLADLDYSTHNQMPRAFHRYFEQPLQEHDPGFIL